MDQIHKDKIKMRPKIYFIAGSVLTFAGLVSSVVASVFLVGLIRFSLRAHGPMASYKFDNMLSSFPWWAPIFSVVGLIVGVWFLRKYDFSFKVNFKIVIIGFILAIVVGGWVIDSIGLNDILSRRGPMKGMMRQYAPGDDLRGGQGSGRGWRGDR